MAIYDAGVAGLSASGQVTGVGTQWTMPLTLIRVGATIIFKTEPVQIYTISEITSDTSLSVHNPNGETVPSGTGYAILAHDGISVQGLAQDVAETLRYYQSNNYVTADENGNVEIANGGTGASSAPEARTKLGLGSVATFDTVPVANGGTGANNASDARDNLELGSVATLNVGTSGDNVPTLNGANTWSQKQTFSTPLAIGSGGTGVNTREELWPAVRPLDVLGNAGRYFGLPAGTTRNQIWMWNQAGTPDAGFANFIEGGWFDSAWRIGGVRSTNVQLSHVQLTVDSAPGPAADFRFFPDGTAQATNWSSTSDPRVKSLIEVIPDPLYLMRGVRGYSWYYEHTGSKGFGFLSSEVKVNFSGAVKTFGDVTLPDGTVVHDVEGVDTSGVSAALHHEAILALMDKIEDLESRLSSLEAGVKS